MYRRRAAFAHSLSTTVSMRRGCCDVSVLHAWHIHGGDRRVVAEGTGQHVTHLIVGTGLHQRRTDPVRGRAIDLPLNNGWIDDRPAVVHRNIIENSRYESVSLHLDDGYMQLRGIGEGQIAELLLLIRHLERR